MGNLQKSIPSFEDLLRQYNYHRNYSDDELADKIGVLLRDIIDPNDIKFPNDDTDITVLKEEITYTDKKTNKIKKISKVIEIKNGNTVIEEPSDIIDLWFNNWLYTLRGKYVSRLIRLFNLTDEQSTEFLFASGCRQNFGKLLEFYMTEKGFNNRGLAKEIKLPLKSGTKKLSKEIGVAPITVGRWIKYGIIPRPEAVKEIAKILELSKEQTVEFYLLAGVTPPIIDGKVIGINDTVRNASIEIINQDESFRELIYPTLGIPISHPNQFFGRTDILMRVKRAWQDPNALQHVSIIGKRRSGKTSLLKYLQYINQTPTTELRPEQQQIWNGWLPKDLQ
ncbi:hypothetical protein QUF50_08755, partial [Thiotrichales bacterium HSG1]|nr:hypothetical protein [Thiotrichales bacterium HSG1]